MASSFHKLLDLIRVYATSRFVCTYVSCLHVDSAMVFAHSNDPSPFSCQDFVGLKDLPVTLLTRIPEY